MKLNRQPNGEVIAVMVNWNGSAFLEKGVSSILSALRGCDDLLIVDNQSTDGSIEFIQTNFPDVALLQTGQNLGGAGGFNAGAEIAKKCGSCKFIWLLDNDIIAEKNALIPLIDLIDSSPKVAAAGSQICLYNTPDIIQEIGGQYGTITGRLIPNYHLKNRINLHRIISADYLAACSMLIKKEIILKHGLFNDFFVFYDDVEWGLRMKKLGYSLVCTTDSVIRHNFSGFKAVTPTREYYRKRNKATCLHLHPPVVGRKFSLWLYLCLLNYRIYKAFLANDKNFLKAYLKARRHVLQKKLGKADFDFYPSKSIKVNPPQKITKYLIIDTPKNIDRELRTDLLTDAGFEILNASTIAKKKSIFKEDTTALIGKKLPLNVLLRSSYIYQLRGELLVQIDQPYLYYIQTKIADLTSIMLSIWRGTHDYFYSKI